MITETEVGVVVGTCDTSEEADIVVVAPPPESATILRFHSSESFIVVVAVVVESPSLASPIGSGLKLFAVGRSDEIVIVVFEGNSSAGLYNAVQLKHKRKLNQ
jgi:hypothetical protein